MFKKGEIYSFDGESRVVIGFDGAGNPITAEPGTPVLSEVSEEVDEIKKEYEEKVKTLEFEITLLKTKHREEIEELQHGNVGLKADCGKLVAEIFKMFDANKITLEELGAIAALLGYSVPPEHTKADIIKRIRQEE